MGMSRLDRRRVFTTRRPTSPFGAPRSQGGPMRFLGRLIVAAIIISAVYLILDFSGRIWAESYVADQVQHSLQLSDNPDVTFGGSLFVPQLVSGDLSSVKVKANDFSSNGMQFTQATLDLQGVGFSPGKLLFHKDSTITARSGRGSASMTDAQLTDAFRVQGVPVNVRFTQDGNVKLSASRFPVAVTVNATIREGRLVLRPANPAFRSIAFALDLPELVHGVSYRSITFAGSLGVLSFRLRDVSFPVPANKPAT